MYIEAFIFSLLTVLTLGEHKIIRFGTPDGRGTAEIDQTLSSDGSQQKISSCSSIASSSDDLNPQKNVLSSSNSFSRPNDYELPSWRKYGKNIDLSYGENQNEKLFEPQNPSTLPSPDWLNGRQNFLPSKVYGLPKNMAYGGSYNPSNIAYGGSDSSDDPSNIAYGGLDGPSNIAYGGLDDPSNKAYGGLDDPSNIAYGGLDDPANMAYADNPSNIAYDGTDSSLNMAYGGSDNPYNTANGGRYQLNGMFDGTINPSNRVIAW